MSQPPIPYLPGHFYHLYNRGCNRENLFQESENYRFTLALLHKYTAALRISIIAYVLMPNHYHLLIRQDGDSPAKGLAQYVFNCYTKAFNLRYRRSGTLFQGPSNILHIDKEQHLLHLCRYIHANPVKAGLVKQPEDWPFSNYSEWIKIRNGKLVDQDFIQEYFDQPQFYAEFVREYLSGLATTPEDAKPYLLD